MVKPKKRLKVALNLLQPWAERVVTGELPILIRSIHTRPSRRVGVYATGSFDKTCIGDFEKSPSEILSFRKVIGSVKIQDCIEVHTDDLMKKVKEIAGEDMIDRYPTQWLPNKNYLYIWVLKAPRKWKQPKVLNQIIGRAWTRIDLEDE